MTTVNICSGPGYYVAQRCFVGERSWHDIGGNRRSRASAYAAAARALANHGVNRARVLWCSEWFEPHVVMEARRP